MNESGSTPFLYFHFHSLVVHVFKVFYMYSVRPTLQLDYNTDDLPRHQPLLYPNCVIQQIMSSKGKSHCKT